MTLKNVLSLTGCLLGLFIALACSNARAQEVAPPELITKVYPVGDLVFVAPNYPYPGTDAPQPQSNQGGVMGGGEMGRGMGGFGGGGGGGGMGGSGGGGFFSVPNQASPEKATPAAEPTSASSKSTTADYDSLIDVIVNSIDASSWEEVGGPGAIVPFNNRLIITQVASTHTKIEKLLTALRDQGTGHNTVTVRVWWLRMNNANYQNLTKGMPSSSPQLVDRKQLDSLAAEVSDHGELTCFDGQTVHLISGRFRNIISTVIPVIGQNNPAPDAAAGQLAALDTPEAQHIIQDILQTQKVKNAAANPLRDGLCADTQPIELAQVIPRAVGYQPVINKIHSGAMIELTPTRLQEEKAIVLDLRSVVTQWSEHSEKDIEFSNVVPLDRTTIVSQRLATTLKLPLRKPVLVGGLSLEPGAADAKDKSQLYLIVEVQDESKEPVAESIRR